MKNRVVASELSTYNEFMKQRNTTEYVGKGKNNTVHSKEYIQIRVHKLKVHKTKYLAKSTHN